MKCSSERKVGGLISIHCKAAVLLRQRRKWKPEIHRRYCLELFPSRHALPYTVKCVRTLVPCNTTICPVMASSLPTKSSESSIFEGKGTFVLVKLPSFSVTKNLNIYAAYAVHHETKLFLLRIRDRDVCILFTHPAFICIQYILALFSSRILVESPDVLFLFQSVLVSVTLPSYNE